MSITLKWESLPSADIASYKIFRSMIGFVTPVEAPYGLVAGDKLNLKINSTDVQTIIFPQDYNAVDMVDFLNNELEDATAYKDAVTNSIYLRPKLRESNCFIEIVSGSAMAKMGLTARIISEKSEFFQIGTVFGDCTEYLDANGAIQDFYCLSTVDSIGNNSKKTSAVQAQQFTGAICVVQGCVSNLQGVRQQDTKVTAKIVCPPEKKGSSGYITDDIVTTLTGEDGKFSLPLLQGAKVLFEIDDTRVSDPVKIPSTSYVDFGTLEIYEEYRFVDL